MSTSESRLVPFRLFSNTTCMTPAESAWSNESAIRLPISRVEVTNGASTSTSHCGLSLSFLHDKTVMRQRKIKPAILIKFLVTMIFKKTKNYAGCSMNFVFICNIYPKS
jgi:hypothetical protein